MASCLEIVGMLFTLDISECIPFPSYVHDLIYGVSLAKFIFID
jgi:hypothetical protein